MSERLHVIFQPSHEETSSPEAAFCRTRSPGYTAAQVRHGVWGCRVCMRCFLHWLASNFMLHFDGYSDQSSAPDLSDLRLRLSFRPAAPGGDEAPRTVGKRHGRCARLAPSAAQRPRGCPGLSGNRPRLALQPGPCEAGYLRAQREFAQRAPRHSSMPSTPVKLQMQSDTRRIELQQGTAATLAELLEHIGAHTTTSLAASHAAHSSALLTAAMFIADGAFGDSGPEQLWLSYIDSEGDKCVIGWDEELVEAQRDAEEDGRLLKINVEAAPAAVQGIRKVENDEPTKAVALGLYAAAVVMGLCMAPLLAALMGWVAAAGPTTWPSAQRAQLLDLLLPPAAAQVAPATLDAPPPARPPPPVPPPPPPVLPPPPSLPPPTTTSPARTPAAAPPTPPARTPAAEPEPPAPPIRRVHTPLADAVAKTSAQLHEVQLPRLYTNTPYSDEMDGVLAPDAAETVSVADLLILDAEAGKAQQQIAEAISKHVIQVQRSQPESESNEPAKPVPVRFSIDLHCFGG